MFLTVMSGEWGIISEFCQGNNDQGNNASWMFSHFCMVWFLSKGNQHAVMSPFPRNIYSSKFFFCCLLLGGAMCLHFIGRWNRESHIYIPKDCEPFESKGFSCSLRRGRGQCAAYINYQHNFRVPLLWCRTKQKTPFAQAGFTWLSSQCP